MDVSKYAALFLAESREHLSSCNQLLLEWERSPARASRSAGCSARSTRSRAWPPRWASPAWPSWPTGMESLLDALRHGRVTPDAGTFELLFRAVDALGEAVEAAAAGRERGRRGARRGARRGHRWRRGERRPAGATPEAAAPHRRRATDARAAARCRSIIRADAVMRGARAMLAVRRAEALGLVTGVRPPLVAARARGVRRPARRSGSSRARRDEELAAAIRTAGEVELGAVRGAGRRPRRIGGGAAPPDPRRPPAARPADEAGRRAGRREEPAGRAWRRGADDPALAELSDRISRLVSGMQAEVIASRMTPVGEVFERFPRLVRDLARDLGKRIRFDVEGEEIELDRSILDEIGDPLLHLIRNAADHGIESPESAAAAGKPPEGRILLAAARERNSVALRVSDDGRGIDRERHPGQGAARGRAADGRRPTRSTRRRAAAGARPAGVQHRRRR